MLYVIGAIALAGAVGWILWLVWRDKVERLADQARMLVSQLADARGKLRDQTILANRLQTNVDQLNEAITHVETELGNHLTPAGARSFVEFVLSHGKAPTPGNSGAN